MVQRIERDTKRFRQKLHGVLGNGLKTKFGEMIARGAGTSGEKNRPIKIPLPQIEIPHFRYGPHGGAGQGEGEVGDSLGGSGQGKKPGEGGGGNEPGGHIQEVEITFQELAKILGDHLKLPRIEPKGKGGVKEEIHRWTQIERVGPESLRHFKRTYKRALRRQIASNTYNPEAPRIIPIREDKLYKGRKTIQIPDVNALAIYMLDVSGSMTDEMKDIVRTGIFWIDTWLTDNYNGIASLFIAFEARAKKVRRQTLLSISAGGGTVMSTPLDLADRLTERGGEIKPEEAEEDDGKRYPANDWNVYGFLFSDGENHAPDTPLALKILKERFLAKCNLFAYTQVEGKYSNPGRKFDNELRGAFSDAENIEIANVDSTADMFNAMQLFFGNQRYAPGQIDDKAVVAAGAHI